MVVIREEVAADVTAREALLNAAFGACRFEKTSERLREGRLPAEGLALVAEREGRLVGTVRMWAVTVGGSEALLLGPLAVDAAVRSEGIGARLMREAIWAAARRGHKAIILVGDAPYYARFGFSTDATARIDLPGPVDRHRLLALEIWPGALSGAGGMVEAAGLSPAARSAPTDLQRAA